MNKVGPYNNPQETYNYYHLHFCKRNQAVKPAHKWGGLGEVLQGNELIDSQLDLRFRSTKPSDNPSAACLPNVFRCRCMQAEAIQHAGMCMLLCSGRAQAGDLLQPPDGGHRSSIPKSRT